MIVYILEKFKIFFKLGKPLNLFYIKAVLYALDNYQSLYLIL